jgi:hypothetical protein
MDVRYGIYHRPLGLLLGFSRFRHKFISLWVDADPFSSGRWF